MRSLLIALGTNNTTTILYYLGMLIRITFVAIGLILVGACGGQTMSKTGPLKSCVFSDIQAVVTLEGEPVKGARIVRRWNWQSEKEDETITDAAGRFEFPAVYERSLVRLIPVEFVVSQSLTIYYKDKEFTFYRGSKRDIELNSELGGKGLNLSCELTHDLEIYEPDVVGYVRTLCILNN